MSLLGSLIGSLTLGWTKGLGIAFAAAVFLFFCCISPSSGVLPNSANPLENFPGDYYKMTGSPYLEANLEKDTVYQDENTTLLLSLKNSGNVSSIRVNEEPAANAPEELYAAKMELELERAGTTAQDISVVLSMPYPQSVSPLEIKRAVAYAGNLREGQVSSLLPFPIEVYKNTTPGDYIVYAIINYTYQSDVAVKPESDRPQNPDIYYLYDSASQVVPLKLRVERRSGAEFEVVGASPDHLSAGSSDNILKVTIENIGYDTAYDVVARLRPESGIYVSVDESPIPVLAPGERAELVYKVDVSKDAVPDKRYMFKLLFEFSDSFRDGLTDTENVYLTIGSGGMPTYLLFGAVIIIVAAAAFIVIRKRRKTV